MKVVNLQTVREERAHRHQHQQFQHVHDQIQDHLSEWHHFANATPVVKDTLYGWFRFSAGYTPGDEELTSFYVVLIAAKEFLGVAGITEICRQYQGTDNDAVLWVVVEGLSRVGRWASQYPHLPESSNPAVVDRYTEQNRHAITEHLIDYLAEYYQAFLPDFTGTRLKRVVFGRQHLLN